MICSYILFLLCLFSFFPFSFLFLLSFFFFLLLWFFVFRVYSTHDHYMSYIVIMMLVEMWGRKMIHRNKRYVGENELCRRKFLVGNYGGLLWGE